MNKAYKVVWNQSSGQWVAVSEAAKNQGKKSALSGTVLAVAMTLAGMGSAQAYTEITGGTLTTQQTSTDTVTYIHDVTINTITGNPSVNVNSTTTADVTIENVNVQTANTGSTASSYSLRGNQGVSIEFKGTNNIELDAATGDTAVIGSTASGAGNVSIGITGVLNIDNKGNWRATENDGLEANANDGTATITHDGAGTIQTAGGNAVFARATGSTGDAVVSLQGSGGADSIELTTSGSSTSSVTAGNHGISAAITNAANTTGQIQIATDAKIMTTGTYANAIRAQTQGGAIEINNGGTLTTSGTGSIGIYTISAGGDNVIKNTGDITTSGASAHGVYANSSGGVISVENTGDITTSGVGAKGIYASSSGSGLIQIQNTGSIYTQDANPSSMAAAIDVRNTSTGVSAGITIVQDGGELKTHSYNGHGIYSSTNATSGDLNVTVKNAVINLTGANSDGIDIQNQNTGTSDLDINITTIGGSIDVFDGSVAPTTTSLSNFGIVAIQFNDAQGDINIKNFGTTITTGKNSDGTGSSSDAIAAYLNGAATSAASNVNIYNEGVLTTYDGSSRGIRVTLMGLGDITVENHGPITTYGTSSHGIWANITNAASTGTMQVVNTGEITTSGDQSYGLYASNAGGGKSTIINTGNITTLSDSSSLMTHAILAENTTTGTSEGIELSVDGATLTTKGYDSTGVRALTSAATGNIDVTITNSQLHIDGINGDGILVQRNNNAVASDLDINVTVVDSEINILQNPSQAGAGNMNFGIAALQYGTAAGDINVINKNTDINVGIGQSGTSSSSGAIYAGFTSNTATGSVTVQNDGNLYTQSDNWAALYVLNSGSGNAQVLNHGNITTQGSTAYGLQANINSAASTGVIQITNTGDITTTGQNATAIYATSTGTGYTGEAITIVNTGDLTVADAHGIYARSSSGDVTVTNTGNITTAQASATTHSHGIDAPSFTGTATVIHDQGVITVNGTNSGGGNAIGIASWDGGSGDANQESYIHLGSQAVVDATGGVGGLQIRTNGYGEINIASGAQVHGGSRYGIQIYGSGTSAGTYVINNAGEIDSVNDRAIFTGGQAGSTLTVNNEGTITGYIDSAVTEVTFNNYRSNSLNLRNYYDSDGDGIRDTKAVSVSTFGGGTFNNAATGTVRLLAVSGETFTDTTGEYVPAGALSTATSGIVQAQLLNLATFDNAGTIDLTGNNQAGDVLVISGGGTAGSYGAGQYISNGGALKLNTHLNYGDLSYSDVLVVDDALSGTGGATRIYITPTLDSIGGVTVNDGIKLVEVLGSSDANTFVLGSPVAYGAYEYVLSMGLTAGNEQNWYLRNTDSSGQIIMSPNAGAYLGNQYAAATMFNQNILDRRESIRNANSNVWMRFNHSDSDTRLFGGRQKADIQTTVFQIGADLLNQNNFIAGVYGGYGHSQIDNKSRQTGSSADGKVDGYHLGGYVSWLPNEHTGPYADAWGYYAWFDNKLQGAGQTGRHSYDSNGYALSIEGGYGFELAAKEDGSAWILKPHAQIIYTHVDADNFTDQSYTRYSGNQGSGIQTRLGGRLYGVRAQGEMGVTPFIEANWLHNNVDSSVNMNGVKVQSDIGRNVAEFKLGVQGQVTEGLSLWGHIGGQHGSDRYSRYEVQFGIGYRWK